MAAKPTAIPGDEIMETIESNNRVEIQKLEEERKKKKMVDDWEKELERLENAKLSTFDSEDSRSSGEREEFRRLQEDALQEAIALKSRRMALASMAANAAGIRAEVEKRDLLQQQQWAEEERLSIIEEEEQHLLLNDESMSEQVVVVQEGVDAERADAGGDRGNNAGDEGIHSEAETVVVATAENCEGVIEALSGIDNDDINEVDEAISEDEEIWEAQMHLLGRGDEEGGNKCTDLRKAPAENLTRKQSSKMMTPSRKSERQIRKFKEGAGMRELIDNAIRAKIPSSVVDGKSSQLSALNYLVAHDLVELASLAGFNWGRELDGVNANLAMLRMMECGKSRGELPEGQS